jgi:hypothetical protein
VQQELIDRYPDKSLEVIFIWAPMMEGDSEEAARQAALEFGAKRAAHFYDPERLAGAAFRKDVFPDAYDQAYASLPADHWLKEEMPNLKSRYVDSPEWDIYMFFGPGVKWNATPPRPTRYVRHLGRIIKKDNEWLSLMWIDAYSNPPTEGKLPVEIGRLGQELFRQKN